MPIELIFLLCGLGSLILGILVGRYFFPANYVVEIPIKPTPRFTAAIFINNYTIQGENLMTKVPFNALSVELSFGAPLDANNNPAQVQDGTLQITSTDDSILTVGPSDVEPDNPYRVKVSFTKKPGAAQVLISADADLGEGAKTITGAETFEISAGEAVSFGPATVGDFTIDTLPQS